MVKSSLVLIVIVSSTLVFAGNITNINQCINTSLTADVLCCFPSNATSTAQNCVLTFIKGSVNGDLRTFASPFSNEIRASEFDIFDMDNIPATIRNEFSTLMTSLSNCTCKVVAYNEMTNNGVVQASITLRRQGIGCNRAETAHLDLVQTNSFWYIINWDVDE